MSKVKYVCPECKQEIAEPRLQKKYGMTLSLPDAEQDAPLKCDPDDLRQGGYCCPVCGYEGPDAEAFVPLS